MKTMVRCNNSDCKHYSSHDDRTTEWNCTLDDIALDCTGECMNCEDEE